MRVEDGNAASLIMEEIIYLSTRRVACAKCGSNNPYLLELHAEDSRSMCECRRAVSGSEGSRYLCIECHFLAHGVDARKYLPV